MFDFLLEVNVVLFSIFGEYGVLEMECVLKNDLYVFFFMDNVLIEDEVCLKKLVYEKGLLMMGFDCGIGIILSILIVFINVVFLGNIGVVGVLGIGI